MWRTWLVINWSNLRNPNSYKSLRHWLYLIIYLAKMVAAINHPWLICYIMININWNISLKIVKLCLKSQCTSNSLCPCLPQATAMLRSIPLKTMHTESRNVWDFWCCLGVHSSNSIQQHSELSELSPPTLQRPSWPPCSSAASFPSSRDSHQER